MKRTWLDIPIGLYVFAFCLSLWGYFFFFVQGHWLGAIVQSLPSLLMLCVAYAVLYALAVVLFENAQRRRPFSQLFAAILWILGPFVWVVFIQDYSGYTASSGGNFIVQEGELTSYGVRRHLGFLLDRLYVCLGAIAVMVLAKALSRQLKPAT